MGLQFPEGGLELSLDQAGGSRLEIKRVLVRLDLWLVWLEVGCLHAEQARLAGAPLVPDMADADKANALTAELHAGLVALTAFAVAIDAFYDTIRHEMGRHPDELTWKKNRTARHAQITETLRFQLKLGHNFSLQLKGILTEFFKFRDRAVHPSSWYIEPNYRPEIDSGVHPHLITFSGPHAVQARALILGVFDRLLDRAFEIAPADVDRGWLDRGRSELDRLIASYRIPGDDALAFPQAFPQGGP
jgi:hypothetical protein